MPVRELDPAADREGLVALYRSNDAKAYQQRVQGIDADRLAAFLADGACKSSHPTWVAEADGKIVGIAALQTAHWHSEHFGFPVGKATQLLALDACPEALDPLLDALEACAQEHGLKHVAGRVDGHAFRAQETLCRRGWYPTGTSVKMAARLSRAAPEIDVNMRLCRPEDREALLRIASEGHDENHLYFDPHLPDEACHAVFRAWVAKCLDSLAAQAWVLEHGGEPAGLCTILDPRSFNAALETKIAVLDYIVLSPALQGQGLGSLFLQAVHAKVAEAGFEQVELRTTATNCAAVNAYAKQGYKLVGADEVFGWVSATD